MTIIASALAAVRKLVRRRKRAALRPIDQTRDALVVARAMADRTGQCLAVVVFTPRAAEVAAATWEVLGRVLPGRLRITDEAGWLDDDRACAILPFTPPAGATKLADDVCLLFPDAVPPPVCTIYTYPTGNVPPHGLHGSGGGTGAAPPPDRSRPAPRAAGGEPPAHAPLEPLFCRPVPVGKRAVDVVGAAAGLIVLAPLLAAVALAIKLTSRGPVFFTQRRAGLGGRPFVMWKFRTMVVDAEALKAGLRDRSEQDGPAFKLKRDPRVTRLGRILRATSIDELPQLWNVLKGEMSLVGPRPLPVGEADRCDQWHRRRLDVAPGLTCIWQVRGRSAVSFDDWVRMDVEYIEAQSMSTDLRLLLATIPAVVLRKGAC